ncbi:MAG TPA: regulatory protein RecX [Solirubrobacteraceae bacterium]|nr:regulatory protein RecX [Solirubrobacteraceae bacterium]
MTAEDAPDAGGSIPLDTAISRCYRHLGEREHTTAQLRRRLLRARVDPDVAEQALEAVREQGYLDDSRYARLLVEDRRRIDGWGAERIRQALESAGVERDLIEESLAGTAHSTELEAATALLHRRLSAAPRDDRERARAFAILIRAGYESEIAYDAIRVFPGDQGGGSLAA